MLDLRGLGKTKGSAPGKKPARSIIAGGALVRCVRALLPCWADRYRVGRARGKHKKAPSIDEAFGQAVPSAATPTPYPTCAELPFPTKVGDIPLHLFVFCKDLALGFAAIIREAGPRVRGEAVRRKSRAE
jgi:hypothetical protein